MKNKISLGIMNRCIILLDKSMNVGIIRGVLFLQNLSILMVIVILVFDEFCLVLIFDF